MRLIDYLPLSGNENRVDGHFRKIIDFFEQNPQFIESKFSTISSKLGGIDYRIVKKVLERYKDSIVQWHEEHKHAAISPITTDDGETVTQTTTADYDGLPTKPNEIASLQQYCEKFHIPYEYLTSAKFINHNGQAAWNVVCDFTKISQIQLDEYYDKLFQQLSLAVEPISITQRSTEIEAAYHFYHSDKHVGAKTKLTALYDNEWSADIFRHRLMSTLDDYVLMSAMFDRYDKVLVSDLGDSVDGWNGKTTRGGHLLPQNMDNKETFDVYVKTMCDFFDALVQLDLANNYEFVAMSNDNHGGDFSYIVNRAVEVYLNVKYPFIKTSVKERFIDCYNYGNHTFMFTHGKDDTDMKAGLPLNLDQKTEIQINEFIDDRKLHDKWLHFIKGDLHQEALNFAKKFRYRNVLSLYGSSAWSMVNYGKAKAGASAEIVFKNTNKIIPLMTTFE